MKVVDLFAGCGGMSLGFQNAGFEIVAAYENWMPAVEIYRKNFSHPAIFKDLTDESVTQDIKNKKPDIIVGGPPCQDFSIAGNRNCNGTRANLTISFANIVAEVNPEWFVMENVYNIEKSKVLPKALDILKNAGYGLTRVVLDASFLGVPQARKRFFLVGRLGEKDNFLHTKLLSNHSEKRMTIKEYFGDKIDTEYYYAHPRSYNRRAVFSVYEPSSTIRSVNRPIPQNYVKHPADKSELNSKIRVLTTKERSMIQTFPESFILEGTKTAMEQVIGNAVPVKMAEHVAKTIKLHIETDI